MRYLFTCIFLFVPAFSLAFSVQQGDVLLLPVPDTCKNKTVSTKGFGTHSVLTIAGKKNILFPIDIHARIGTTTLTSCTSPLTKEEVVITTRSAPVITFTIPESQGGNTKANAQKVTSSIGTDARVVSLLWSNPKQLWKESFKYPLATTTVTDIYGYTRDSAGSSILHKGTDFKADLGTSVYAANRGVVRLAKKLPLYGNIVVIDHGAGVRTLYLHLSQISVKVGTVVEKGQLIGKSGATGFATGPHLHFSVHIDGVSIDPEVFMKLVGE
jgi:hypothetical protein